MGKLNSSAISLMDLSECFRRCLICSMAVSLISSNGALMKAGLSNESAVSQMEAAYYAGWTNNAGSMIVNPGKFLALAVGSLTQPLFARGEIIAQYKITKLQQEEAALAFQQSLLNAGSEVNDALTACPAAKRVSCWTSKSRPWKQLLRYKA